MIQQTCVNLPPLCEKRGCADTMIHDAELAVLWWLLHDVLFREAGLMQIASLVKCHFVYWRCQRTQSVRTEVARGVCILQGVYFVSYWQDAQRTKESVGNRFSVEAVIDAHSSLIPSVWDYPALLWNAVEHADRYTHCVSSVTQLNGFSVHSGETSFVLPLLWRYTYWQFPARTHDSCTFSTSC